MPVARDKGVLQNRPSWNARRRFSQYVARHLHAHQLGAESADFDPLGACRRFVARACELALAMGLDPVEQRLLDHAERVARP